MWTLRSPTTEINDEMIQNAAVDIVEDPKIYTVPVFKVPELYPEDQESGHTLVSIS